LEEVSSFKRSVSREENEESPSLGRDLCPKGPLLNAWLLNRRFFERERGHLARLAPAAVVSALRGRIALPGEDAREETTNSFAFSKHGAGRSMDGLEQDAPAI
jgi:hypothetical protein